jgi:myosin heavy subunit
VRCLNRVPRDLEKRVLQKHFEVIPRDAIAQELSISSGTVSEILSILPPSLNSLRELSVALRRNNMIIQDALQAVNIRDDLIALGIKPDQFSSSLQAVMKISWDGKYNPEDILQSGTRLIELENQAGKPYPEALDEFELVNAKNLKKQKRIKKLNTQNAQLQAQIKKNEERLTQAFRTANEAPEELAEFKKQREELSQHGIKIPDVKTISKFLVNIKETGGSAKRTVSLVKNVGSLKKKKAELNQGIKGMNLHLACLKNKKESLEEEISYFSSQRNQLENEIESKLVQLGSLNQQISRGNSQLWYIQNEYERLNALRKDVIAQTGKMLRMCDNEILELQTSADFEITYQSILQRFKKSLLNYWNSTTNRIQTRNPEIARVARYKCSLNPNSTCVQVLFRKRKRKRWKEAF